MIEKCIELAKGLAIRNTYVRINDHRDRCTNRTHWWSADLVQDLGADDLTAESGQGESPEAAISNLHDRLFERLHKEVTSREEQAHELRDILTKNEIAKVPT